MRIAIDSSALSSGHKIRGVGKYTKNLIVSLQELSKKKKDFTVDAVEIDLVGKEKLAKYDIIHYPYFDLFFDTLPTDKPTNTVVTIHDVIPLLYPDHYPSGIRGKIKFLKQRQSLQSTKAVITDTETSKKDIIRFLNYPDKKIFPIHLAPAFNFKKASDTTKEKIGRKFKLPKEFILYVGDVNYNKNVAELVKACALLKITLVIVGKQAQDLETQMSKAQLEGSLKDRLRYIVGQNHPELAHFEKLEGLFNKHKDLVIRLGYLEDEELNCIWQMASVYCQPSLYEGFGLPVVESFAAGVPVVASLTQALVEIAGDAAIFVENKSAKGFAESLKKVLKDKQKERELVQLGKKQLKKYSWDATARKTYEVYQRVLESK